MSLLKTDSNSTPIQVFTPSVTFAPFALSAATRVLRLRGTLGGGELDCRSAKVLTITPSTNSLTRHFDSDTTKTRTLASGASNTFGIPDYASTCTISGTDASIEIEAM
jgi:hypothetical protein